MGQRLCGACPSGKSPLVLWYSNVGPLCQYSECSNTDGYLLRRLACWLLLTGRLVFRTAYEDNLILHHFYYAAISTAVGTTAIGLAANLLTFINIWTNERTILRPKKFIFFDEKICTFFSDEMPIVFKTSFAKFKVKNLEIEFWTLFGNLFFGEYLKNISLFF